MLKFIKKTWQVPMTLLQQFKSTKNVTHCPEVENFYYFFPAWPAEGRIFFPDESGSGDRILNISGGPINSGPQSSGHSELQTSWFTLEEVFRIHGNLMWIRIRSGSADPGLWLMQPDSDPDPAIFVIDLQDANIKKFFVKNFFCLLVFEGAFTSFLKDKKSKEVAKQYEPMFFLTIFACW
jgi:hypothetical protein